jgi:hypothetical protein
MQDWHDEDRAASNCIHVHRIRFAVGQEWICEEMGFVNTEIRDDTSKQCGKAAETNVTMQTDCFIT